VDGGRGACPPGKILAPAMNSRVPIGQGKLEKVREYEWSGKGQG